MGGKKQKTKKNNTTAVAGGDPLHDLDSVTSVRSGTETAVVAEQDEYQSVFDRWRLVAETGRHVRQRPGHHDDGGKLLRQLREPETGDDDAGDGSIQFIDLSFELCVCVCWLTKYNCWPPD